MLKILEISCTKNLMANLAITTMEQKTSMILKIHRMIEARVPNQRGQKLVVQILKQTPSKRLHLQITLRRMRVESVESNLLLTVFNRKQVVRHLLQVIKRIHLLQIRLSSPRLRISKDNSHLIRISQVEINKEETREAPKIFNPNLTTH